MREVGKSWAENFHQIFRVVGLECSLVVSYNNLYEKLWPVLQVIFDPPCAND